MKDEFRSGRSSTNRSEVNVERVRQVVCGYCRLKLDWLKVSWTRKKTMLGRLSPKISKTAKWQSNRCIRVSSSVYKLNETCFIDSSLAIKQGCFSTAQKLNARAVSRSLWRRWGRSKQDCQNHKRKSCWSRSSVWGTASSYHRARQSISKSTKRFVVYGRELWQNKS